MTEAAEELVAVRRGPGRPPTGTPILVRIPADMLAAVDAESRSRGVTRAQLIREIIAAAVRG